MKPHSKTRWECCMDSVETVRYHIVQFYDALVDIAKETNEHRAPSEAKSLCSEFQNVEYLVWLVFWYGIFFQVNQVRKQLHDKTIELSVAIKRMNRTIAGLQKYKTDGFDNALADTKEIASDMDIKPVFCWNRICRRNYHFNMKIKMN